MPQRQRRSESPPERQVSLSLLGVLAGVGYWVVDAFVGTQVFDEGSFFTSLVFPGAEHAWMRTFTSVCLFAFGAYAQTIRRRQQELHAAVRASDARLHMAVDAAEMGTWMWDVVQNQLHWDATTYALFGMQPGTQLETFQGLHALAHPDDQATVAAAIQEALYRGGNYEVEYRVIRPDGTERVHAARGSVTYDAAGTPLQLQGVVWDVTDRREAEATMRRLQQVVEATTDLVSLVDQDGRLLYLNRAGRRLLGYGEHDDLSGLSSRDCHPAATATLLEREAIPAAERDGTWSGETLFLTKDGREILTWQIVIAHKSSQGQLAFVSTIARDLTERLQIERERRRLEEQVQYAQRIESLGMLAGGVAHDFNNLLTGILGGTELATLDLPPGSPVHEHIADIRTSALHAAELTKQMLAYSGKGRFIVEAVKLDRLIRDMAQLLETALPKGVVLQYGFAPDIPAVEADASQLRQVITNLVINAGEAIGDAGGTVTVSTGTIVADAAYLDDAHLGRELSAGEYVCLVVADTGPGMDAQAQAHLFDPFFTTKFQGRGLGLAAVLGIVRGHRGAIKVESELGRGSTFTVLLPGSAHLPAEPAAVRAGDTDWRGAGTVLVVEDEKHVQHFVEQVLARCGFTVLTADDGLQGVELFRAHARDIVLVVLDMMMPRLNGAQTYAEIRRIRPDARVVVSSGYDEQEASARFAGDGLAGFVQKPYHVSTLVAAVRAALDA